MKKINVPIWDEGGHVVVSRIVVSGRPENVAKIQAALEAGVQFVAARGGDPLDMYASEFIRKKMKNTPSR